jgi:hypothetical protein
MALVTLKQPDQPLDTFLTNVSAVVIRDLPVYARPLFLRVLGGEEQVVKTSTFKYQKHVYLDQGFDPHRLSPTDSLFCWMERDGQHYVRIDAGMHAAIIGGQVKF